MPSVEQGYCTCEGPGMYARDCGIPEHRLLGQQMRSGVSWGDNRAIYNTGPEIAHIRTDPSIEQPFDPRTHMSQIAAWFEDEARTPEPVGHLVGWSGTQIQVYECDFCFALTRDLPYHQRQLQHGHGKNS